MWLRICRAQSQENPAEQDPAKLCLPFIGDLPSPAAAAGYDVATCRNAMQQADDAAGQLKTAYGLLPLRRQVWSRDINTKDDGEGPHVITTSPICNPSQSAGHMPDKMLFRVMATTEDCIRFIAEQKWTCCG